MLKGPLGSTPWQASIGGGAHHSFSEFMTPEWQPILGQYNTRGVPASPAAPGAFPHRVSTGTVQALVDKALAMSESAPDVGKRKLTICPYMRQKGVCRCPSCPYIHEVFRPKKLHTPFYNTHAPKECKQVPCRFIAVMGQCPYGDRCVYSHEGAPPQASEDADVTALLAATKAKAEGAASKTGAEEAAPEQATADVEAVVAARPGMGSRPPSASKGGCGSSRPPSAARSSRPTSATRSGGSRPSSAARSSISSRTPRPPSAASARDRQRMPFHAGPWSGDSLGNPGRERLLSGHVAVHDVLSSNLVTGIAAPCGLHPSFL